ncbi:MAG: Dickkopf N-terminal cysteine-rich domain-containing protein, partial [Myxococcales bacterium]|nr:Dickkopf N-terminal cysteine-rich domain-containing protein [Myxococcales bacterium]
GGAAAGGDAGGAAAGGAAAGGVAGGSTAGGAAAGGSAAGGSAGGAVAGGSAAGGTASDGGVYDFCAEVAQRECDFYIRCVAAGSLFGDTVTNRPNNVAPATQRSLCEATRRDECRIQQAGAERGRRAVNLTALRTCLDAQFPSASCVRDRNAELSVCDISAFTTPLAAPGSICTSSDECAGGYCNIGGGGATCGQCVRFVNPDGGTATCNTAAACAPGTFCRQAIGPDQCTPLRGADAGCGSSAECAPGYVCPFTGATGRVCTLGKLEGDTCVKGRIECFRTNTTDFELLCATQPGVTDGGADRCVRRFNTTAGGFCNTSETGTGIPAGPSCLDTEYCNNGLCEPRRAATQPCGTNNEVCQAGSRCFQGICTAYGDVGATCTGSEQCRALLYCAGATMGSMGTCQPFLAVTGGMCSTTGFPNCTNASYCPGQGMQTCVAQKPNGQACMTSVECLNGSCNGACGNACWR